MKRAQAILINKAEQGGAFLSKDAAFFIAQRIRSNVRELEGALKRVMAHAQFTRRPIDIDLIRESLKDLLALQDKLVTIDNIQRVVADYYQLKMSDLLSKDEADQWRVKTGCYGHSQGTYQSQLAGDRRVFWWS